MKIVTFLSDYGLESERVGICHGVMMVINPSLKILDLDHRIVRRDISHGALLLSQSVGFLPPSVCLVVVEPAGEAQRKGIAVESGSGRIFVGPDNGVLMAAVARSGGVSQAYKLSDERYMLTPSSSTFRGRDVFAPIAAYIALGVDLAKLGPRVAATNLVALEIPEAWVHDDHLHARVLRVDHFGNLYLNFGCHQLQEIGLGIGSKAAVHVEDNRFEVPIERAFASVDSGDYALIDDFHWGCLLGINGEDAAARLNVGGGHSIILRPLRLEDKRDRSSDSLWDSKRCASSSKFCFDAQTCQPWTVDP